MFFLNYYDCFMIEELIVFKAPLVALVLLFWFKTNVVWTYGKMFGLKKILSIDKFEEKLRFNPDMTYQVFIATTYRGFFARLLSCNVCFATWISLFVLLVDVGICCYNKETSIQEFSRFIVTVPANIIFGLIYFGITKKII